MTPQQQKAKELVEKFEDLEWNEPIKFETGISDVEMWMPKNVAKQCALISCDFSIAQLTQWKNTYSGRKQIEEIQSVKQEINKLT